MILKKMKFLKYKIVIYILFLVSCNNVGTPKKISELDVDFVAALKKKDKKKYIVSIDSVLNSSDLNKGRKALLHLKKGALLSKIYQYEEGIKNLEFALSIFNEKEEKKYLAKTYWHLGSSNAFLSNRIIANEQLLKALGYSIQIKDKKIEANIYGSLAHIHYLYKDYLTSIAYTKKTIKTYEFLKDSLGLSSTYNNLLLFTKI